MNIKPLNENEKSELLRVISGNNRLVCLDKERKMITSRTTLLLLYKFIIVVGDIGPYLIHGPRLESRKCTNWECP